MTLLGAHLSAAGGAWRAVEAAAAIGCDAVQLFLRSPGRWDAPPLDRAAIAAFRSASRAARLGGRCFAHAPYLLNLASAETALRQRSIGVLVDELERAEALGLAGVVLHPGSAGGGDRDDAESRCRDGLAEAVERAGPRSSRVLLEVTAGAGGQLGRTPGELARLLPRHVTGRVGLCLDTAHLWGAGYDVRGAGWDDVLREVSDAWGVSVPDLIHGNDTPVERGSHLDRHAPPGAGQLGEGFYRRLVADERLRHTPVVLEIPPGKRNALVIEALSWLRSLRGGASSSRA